jgi:acetylornithine deacetylase/succinyl-diaminopimelate desuccinylase-like protein
MGKVVDRDAAIKARGLMPQLRSDLEALVRIPSISVPGRVDQPLLDAFEMTSRLFADAGVTVDRLDLPDTAPVVTGAIPAPPVAPTVLLYSHYDVVPPGDETLWSSPPFEPTERDGALVARGVADTKSNILAHVGALRAWDGRPPIPLAATAFLSVGRNPLAGIAAGFGAVSAAFSVNVLIVPADAVVTVPFFVVAVLLVPVIWSF